MTDYKLPMVEDKPAFTDYKSETLDATIDRLEELEIQKLTERISTITKPKLLFFQICFL